MVVGEVGPDPLAPAGRQAGGRPLAARQDVGAAAFDFKAAGFDFAFFLFVSHPRNPFTPAGGAP